MICKNDNKTTRHSTCPNVLYVQSRQVHQSSFMKHIILFLFTKFKPFYLRATCKYVHQPNLEVKPPSFQMLRMLDTLFPVPSLLIKFQTRAKLLCDIFLLKCLFVKCLYKHKFYFIYRNALPMGTHIYHFHSVPTEARRGYWSFWNWSFGCL